MIDLKSIVRMLVIAAAGLLSSCIDSREEYWFQADGSGRAEITYQIPTAVASAHGGESGVREMIVAFLKHSPEITASTFEVVTEETRIRVKITAAFDSALDLENLTSGDSLEALSSAASHFAGEVTADLHGQTLDFSRRISASKALPGAAFLPASQFDGHRMLYIMHLPAVPTESNATRVEDAGRTLVWDIPLAQAIQSPLITRFKVELPIPWRLVAAIVVPFSLVCGFVLLRIRKSRCRFSVGASQIAVL